MLQVDDDDDRVRFVSFPRTEPPPHFAAAIVDAFTQHHETISTRRLDKGLTSDGVMAVVRPALEALGFDVEKGKRADEKIKRPVFFGADGVPELQYEIDAYHPDWRCGLEVEAGRAWLGNAVYRDIVQALVMVQVDCLVIAVANTYKYKSGAKVMRSKDFENTVSVAEALYSHSRMRLPYSLVVVGY